MSRLFPWVVVVALVVMGCSTSVPVLEAPTHVAVARPTDAPVEAIRSAPTSVAAPGPVAGAGRDPVTTELRLAVTGAPVTDPLAASVVNPTDMVTIDLLYDGLTAWDEQAGTWQPALATSLTAAPDGLSWTVDLDDAASFSDGTAVTAADIRRTFERIFEDDLGFAASRLDMIDDIVVVDEESVRFDLARPYALLPSLLTSPVYGVVPDGPLDGSVGSGPMTRTVPDVLTPRVEAGVTQVRLVEVADEAEAAAARAAGEVDLAYVGSSYGGEVDLSRDATVEAHFGLNVTSPVLADAEVRRAVVDAIGRVTVTDQTFAAAATPVERLQPELLACTDPCGGSGPAPALAIGALRVAYVEDASGREAAMAAAVVAELEANGIEATAIGTDLPAFVDAVGRGDFDLARTGWIGLFPSPDSQLAPYVSTSPDNLSGYSDPTFDELVATARLSGTPADYDAARQRLELDAAVVPIARLQIRALVDGSVAGLLLRHDGTFALDGLTVQR